MSVEAELTFRSFNADDINFIQSSWGSSYYKGNYGNRSLSPEDFHAYHRPIRERFLYARPNATIIVCSSPEDPGLIIGWIAVERCPSALILQYLYVKSAFKGEGIGALLIKRALPGSPVLYTHMTDQASRIMAKKYDAFKQFRYVPHLV